MIAHPHIRLDERGVARIDDANIKVIEVVLDPEVITTRGTLTAIRDAALKKGG